MTSACVMYYFQHSAMQYWSLLVIWYLIVCKYIGNSDTIDKALDLNPFVARKVIVASLTALLMWQNCSPVLAQSATANGGLKVAQNTPGPGGTGSSLGATPAGSGSAMSNPNGVSPAAPGGTIGTPPLSAPGAPVGGTFGPSQPDGTSNPGIGKSPWFPVIPSAGPAQNRAGTGRRCSPSGALRYPAKGGSKSDQQPGCGISTTVFVGRSD